MKNQIRDLKLIVKAAIDEHSKTELDLFIQNDGDLYRQKIIPIVKNLKKKIEQGKYDHTKAPKMWMYLIDEGVKRYIRDYGGDKSMFPKNLKTELAKEYADMYKEKIDLKEI